MTRLFAALAVAIGIAAPNVGSAQAQMTELSDNVYHFFSDWYGSLVVISDDGVLVTDPAWSDRAETMKAEIAKLTDQDVTHVVLTHEHYDHVGGTEVFDGADIICHVSCVDIFALDESGVVPRQVTMDYYTDAAIILGDKTVELIHLGPGDGVGTTIIHVPEDRVAMTADLYLPQALTEGKWLDDKNFLGTCLILNEMAGWNLQHAISGHAESTDPAAVTENAQYLNDLHAAVMQAIDEAVAEGGPDAAWGLLDTLPESLKLPQYASWDGYEEHLPTHTKRMLMSILHGG